MGPSYNYVLKCLISSLSLSLSLPPSPGSLLINSLGILTPLSDTLSPSLLISHNFSSSSLFWSTATPTQRTSYTLTISAELLKEEPLPITLPTLETPPTSPEDPRWPCTSAQVGGDEGVWSSVSSLTQILSSPSLINNNISTKRNLKVRERENERQRDKGNIENQTFFIF